MSRAFRWGKNAKNFDASTAIRESCFPTALCLHFLSPWRLFGCLAGRLFWRSAGSSLTVMTTYLCRQVWMFCQHSSIYDRSQMWVQEHTVLYPNPEINETWLPSRPQIPKCVCVCVYWSDCVCVCMSEKRDRRLKGGSNGKGEELLKASSRKRSSSEKKKKRSKVLSSLHVHFFNRSLCPVLRFSLGALTLGDG